MRSFKLNVSRLCRGGAVGMAALFLGFVLIAGPRPAHAQEGKPVVVVLDVERVLSESAAAKTIRDAVDEKRKAYESEIDQDRRRLKTEEEELLRQKTILSPDVFTERRRQLDADYTELRRRADRFRDSLNDAVNKARLELRNAMATVLADIMKERGIEMTLERRAVLLFDEKLNITDEVLVKLDKRLPSVDVTFREPPAN